MARTLLQLVNDTQDELGITRSNAVISGSDDQTRQLRALINRLGIDLVRDYEWQKLTTIYVQVTSTAVTQTGSFASGATVVTGLSDTSVMAVGQVVTGDGIAPYAEIASINSGSQITMNTPSTAAGSSVSLTFANQYYSLPSDYHRMIGDTNWDRTNHWRNLGPKSMQEWTWITGGIISTGPRERYKIENGKLKIFRALTAATNLAYAYISKWWVYDSSASSTRTLERYGNDDDTCVFDDDVMVLGLKYRWQVAKGLDFTVSLGEFMKALSASKAQDEPAPALSLSPQPAPLLVGPWSIPDGNWPT